MVKKPLASPLILSGAGSDRLAFIGELTARTPGAIWVPVLKSAAELRAMTFDLSGLSHLDLNGAAQLLWLKGLLEKKGVKLKLTDPPEHLRPIWELASQTLGPPSAPPASPNFFQNVGLNALGLYRDSLDLISFLGEILVNFFKILPSFWRFRWKATLAIAEVSAVNAFPVTALVALLVGLILAFQAAMFMKLFGVTIFVADLVGLSIIRELGTLLTAIVLTGRSGSAFSAQLGAMKSNQEIDAFITMGLSPVRDLALPRIMALTLATPFLTVLADFAGLVGGNVVMVTLGYPVIVFWQELSTTVDLSDIATGLFKSLVFGFTVASIGCQRGLATGPGAEAVGEATTKGVVTNIVVLAALDSLFAVLFYVLNW